MGRCILHGVLLAGIALGVDGCGFADSHAPVPEFMRARVAELAPEPPPDAKRLVRDKLDTIFSANSHPHSVRVSMPRHEPTGADWTACVRAELTSVTGKPLGTQTYRITIGGGAMLDRRRVEADDNCASENYEPI